MCDNDCAAGCPVSVIIGFLAERCMKGGRLSLVRCGGEEQVLSTNRFGSHSSTETTKTPMNQ